MNTVTDRILLFGGILKLGSQKRPKWVIYLNKLEQVQAIKTEQNVSIIKIDNIKKGNTPV